MKGKKLLALGLSGMMIAGSLAACGGDTQSQDSTEAPQTTTAAESTAQTEASAADTGAAQDSESEAASGDTVAAQDTGAASDVTYNVTWDDLVDINIVQIAPGAIPTGVQEVEDAINEITEAQINVHVNFEMLEMGNYAQQVSLMMSSSEQVDLLMSFPVGAATFTSMVTQNQLMDITDLMSEYGQPILDTVGQYINATTVNGRIYGVPTYRNYASGSKLIMRTDVLEDLGLVEQAESITSLSELGDILEAVKSSEKWSYLAGLSPASGNGDIAYVNACYIAQTPGAENTLYDGLSSQVLAVDASGDDPTVKLIADLPEYKELYETIHDWYEKGYIYQDSATTSDFAADLIRSNVLFATIMTGEYGYEATAESQAGMDLTAVPLVDTPITTGGVTGFAWCVPNSSAEPEAAITFMSMMYTSPEISNLMAWGIEGRDYIVEDGVAKYPDGNSEVPYHSDDFLIGNQFLALPWEGNSATMREESQAQVESAPISAYLGFTANTDSIATEVSALSNVYAEFGPQIETGMAAPEVYDQFVERLYSNGAQKVIDEYQRQLDEWIAQNQ
ncbi:putative aldouronate transport system substrate-binding protein [Catenibacillus scindens]|uniref:Putative aldouronate transport system substrate-binding protein n=1 Tax=Catenibacillus scindens TaxID=673271 RepID=A0A7W8H992_9FIRM|nr:ABC transporter substrate-binding protein [Catenibacillus scindens]MBB5264058.1 putative aldouronate transport system substrate-binding protein [Catenibacillus scindens]